MKLKLEYEAAENRTIKNNLEHFNYIVIAIKAQFIVMTKKKSRCANKTHRENY